MLLFPHLLLLDNPIRSHYAGPSKAACCPGGRVQGGGGSWFGVREPEQWEEGIHAQEAPASGLGSRSRWRERPADECQWASGLRKVSKDWGDTNSRPEPAWGEVSIMVGGTAALRCVRPNRVRRTSMQKERVEKEQEIS